MCLLWTRYMIKRRFQMTGLWFIEILRLSGGGMDTDFATLNYVELELINDLERTKLLTRTVIAHEGRDWIELV